MSTGLQTLHGHGLTLPVMRSAVTDHLGPWKPTLSLSAEDLC